MLLHLESRPFFLLPFCSVSNTNRGRKNSYVRQLTTDDALGLESENRENYSDIRRLERLQRISNNN